jgi:hypothetical protein
VISSFPSSNAFFKNTQTPTYVVTKRPTKLPVSLAPSRSPILLPSVSPSWVPTKFVSPTMSLTPSPSTIVPSKKPSLRPSHTSYPSSSPTSMPSLSIFSQGKSTTITEGGLYKGENGAARIIILSQANIHIKGNQGKKHYVISLSTGNNITITIEDFKSSLEEETGQGDVLDFSELSSLTYFYSTNPLTFHLLSPNHIVIILSSHSSYDLGFENVLYPDTTSVNAESGYFFKVLEEFILFSKKPILLIAIVTSAFILTFFLLNCGRNRTAKTKDSAEIHKNFEDNFSGSLRSSLFGSFDDRRDRELSQESCINFHSNDSDLDAVMQDGNGTMIKDVSSVWWASLNASRSGVEEEVHEENYSKDIQGGEEELDEVEFYSDSDGSEEELDEVEFYSDSDGSEEELDEMEFYGDIEEGGFETYY